MREFASEMGEVWLRMRAAEIGLALALGPAFAWVGPFGVQEEPFLAKLGFWSGLLASWFIVVAMTELWLRRYARFSLLGHGTRRAAVIAGAALPMIFITGPAINALNGWEATTLEVTELYFQIIVIGFVVTLLGDALVPPFVRQMRPRLSLDFLPATSRPSAPVADEDAVSPAAPKTPCPLITRLPPEIRAPLICLEMQDHYVRVHTKSGSTLLLMRLRDAIAETSPIAGRQIHRSWWVSDGAVETFQRNGRAASVQLTNGLRAPVSQRYLKEVEDACGTSDSLRRRS